MKQETIQLYVCIRFINRGRYNIQVTVNQEDLDVNIVITSAKRTRNSLLNTNTQQGHHI